MNIKHICKLALLSSLSYFGINDVAHAYIVHARANLQYVNSENKVYPHYITYKQSYFLLADSYRIGYADLGWLSVSNFAYRFNPNFHKFYQQKLVLFVNSDVLGKTEIGRNSSLLADYFSKIQHFTIANSGIYPFIRAENIINNFTWKYNSKKDNYYHYGYSFNLKEHKYYGNYSGQAFFLDWKFTPFDNNDINLGFLVAKQTTKDLIVNGRFVSHPIILSLGYKFNTYFDIKVSGFYNQERYKDLTSSTKLKNRNFGQVYSVVVSPFTFVDIYSNYIVSHYQNSNAITSKNGLGAKLPAHSANVSNTWTSGIRFKYHGTVDLELFGEYSKNYTKTYLDQSYTTNNFISTGLAIIY